MPKIEQNLTFLTNIKLPIRYAKVFFISKMKEVLVCTDNHFMIFKILGPLKLKFVKKVEIKLSPGSYIKHIELLDQEILFLSLGNDGIQMFKISDHKIYLYGSYNGTKQLRVSPALQPLGDLKIDIVRCKTIPEKRILVVLDTLNGIHTFYYSAQNYLISGRVNNYPIDLIGGEHMEVYNDVLFIAGVNERKETYLREYMCLKDRDYLEIEHCTFQLNREVIHFDTIDSLYINSKYLYAISGNLIMNMRHSVTENLMS